DCTEVAYGHGPMPHFDVADGPLARADAVDKVRHVIIRCVEPYGVLWQRILEKLGVASLDPLAIDEDPASIADEPVAVFAVAARDQMGAVGVTVGYREVRVDVVAVGFVRWLAAGCGHSDRSRAVLPKAPLSDVVVVRAPIGELSA